MHPPKIFFAARIDGEANFLGLLARGGAGQAAAVSQDL